MKSVDHINSRPLMILIAGAKGAVASTLAVATSIITHCPELIVPYLTTSDDLGGLGKPGTIQIAGWDSENGNLIDALNHHNVLSPQVWKPYQKQLLQIPISPAPDKSSGLTTQVEKILKDISRFRSLYPDALPVMVNLLPAASMDFPDDFIELDDLYNSANTTKIPDIAYVLAAIFSAIPVVNFTPNAIELPVICQEAEKRGVPVCGRDGKTGQTYLKVAMASALKARSLKVDGWYSLNILGNDDGKNLMNPDCAAGKLANKTELLNDILGYSVGENYGTPTHKVVIDYYPPRGDAKEAWDVIDFKGLFGLPMSIRINFLCRDSILAAPLVIDLARWMAATSLAGRKGPIAELGFYFKKPIGNNPPITFEQQIMALTKLREECRRTAPAIT